MRQQADERSASRWRTVLEARWRLRLQELTELSLAYHAVAGGPAGAEDRHSRRLLRRAVAARRQLADTEDALGRVTAGSFGRCEQCGSALPTALLTAAPESRYCAACGDPARPVPAMVSASTAAGLR
jgi:RNA polymerase-binding transcription factor DksA